jgi:hypothetical protein
VGTSSKTLLVYRKFSGESLYNKGQGIDDYYPPGSLQIKEKDDSVTRELGGQIYISKPPHFTAMTAACSGPLRYMAVR